MSPELVGEKWVKGVMASIRVMFVKALPWSRRSVTICVIHQRRASSFPLVALVFCSQVLELNDASCVWHRPCLVRVLNDGRYPKRVRRRGSCSLVAELPRDGFEDIGTGLAAMVCSIVLGVSGFATKGANGGHFIAF